MASSAACTPHTAATAHHTRSQLSLQVCNLCCQQKRLYQSQALGVCVYVYAHMHRPHPMLQHPHISAMVSPMHSPHTTNTQPLSCQRVNCVLAPLIQCTLTASHRGWVRPVMQYATYGQPVSAPVHKPQIAYCNTDTDTQRGCMTGRCAYDPTSAGSTASPVSWSSSASEPGCCFCCCSARCTAHAFFTSTRLHTNFMG